MTTKTVHITLALLLSVAATACEEGGDSEGEDEGLAEGIAAEAIVPSGFVVNECRTGSSGWIELYNGSGVALDLANDASQCWSVDDIAGGGAPKRITDSVTNHAPGSTTCAAAGRSATCALVAPGERVWVNYAYVNGTTADACRLVQSPRSGGVCGSSYTEEPGSGATTSTVAGQCFGRESDGGAWSSGPITCSASGATNGGCTVGGACSDGDACTTGEALDANCACTGGAVVSCDDGNACTADACDAALGCSATPVANGTACGTDLACQDGACVASCAAGSACDDGDACTTGEVLAADCSCGGGTALTCDDSDPCTSDACEPAGGCTFASRADGASCGANLVCEAGACVPGSGGATLTDGAESRILLVGTIVGPTGPFDGELLVEGNIITCVASSCSAEPGAAGATRVETDGVILPGLIDSHNHGLFGVFDESDWSPSQPYTNHNQWTASPRYKQLVDAKQYLTGEDVASPVDYRCEMDKYGEMKALIAGTTSQLVAPGAERMCFASMIRTIDTAQNDLGFDRIQTSISVPSNATAAGICSNFGSGKTDAYVVHVGEGIDATARKEFATLASRSNGCLLSPKTTIVHGTAFGASEFTTMAQNGMRLVWSPRSNEFLYGETASISAAIAAGVETIALAPDWSIGGSRNMLEELRYASELDAAEMGGLLGAERLVRMVTLDAAKALGLEAYLGSLEVGKRADILIVPPGAGDVYEAVIAASPETVQLVMVDGRVLYGDDQLVAAGPASPGCEAITIGATDKFACIAEAASTDKLDQTYAQIRTELDGAFSDYDAAFMTPSTGFSPVAPLY